MKKLMVLIVLCLSVNLFSQIDITFRHYPTSDNVVRAFVPGTFNGWGPNSNGRISPTAQSVMTYHNDLGFYYKRLTLQVGVTYNYKFHEHFNGSGSEWQWLTDPLNPLINFADNNNSIIRPSDAMIFELSPRPGATLAGDAAVVAAGAFVKKNDAVLASESKVFIDGLFYSTFENAMIDSLSLLWLNIPDLPEGEHTVVLELKSQAGFTAKDSTRFLLVKKSIFFETPDIDSVWASEKTIRWRDVLPPGELEWIHISHNGKPAQAVMINDTGEYDRTVRLAYGENIYVVSHKEKTTGTVISDTLRINYPEPQAPTVSIDFVEQETTIEIKALAADPQSDPVTFLWSLQPLNPEPVENVDGATDSNLVIPKPMTPGDYSFKVTATDPAGHSASAINFFTIEGDGSVIIPEIETIPAWVKNAQIYCLFVKALTREGTFEAAVTMLDHVRDMGFNTIWVLPVMDVEGLINQMTNIGYNIVDFYNVEPFYGTNTDFGRFVQEAHNRGLRVILDVTPNHSSRSHPIALDARANRRFSRFYDFYQHDIIPHNTNGLGQSITSDGIVYYSGFSDALLNWNWSDAEARQYMIDVYKHWIREYDIDGFRFDVYWGPHRRYGRENFDIPLRQQLRALKSDILLLGETNGTGSGSEVHYADTGGGIDMGYDWALKDAIWRFPSPAVLDGRLYNGGYRPGPNSLFLRFLENQDEDRVAYRYNSIEKTIPVSAAIHLATGIPLVYQGQEVGMGYRMGGNKDDRARATVNWQQSFAKILAPHYQKLAQIRKQFPAFRTQFEDTNDDGEISNQDRNVQQRIVLPDWTIYAYARPYPDENGLVLANFSDQEKQVKLPLSLQEWADFSLPPGVGENLYLNDLYNSNTTPIVYTGQDSLVTKLPPYGVQVYVISRESRQLKLPALEVKVGTRSSTAPQQFALHPNFPNPFNPSTTISFRIPVDSMVQVEIFNVQGRKIRTLMNEPKQAGEYSLQWNGEDELGRVVSSGLYICRVAADDYTAFGKMTLLK